MQPNTIQVPVDAVRAFIDAPKENARSFLGTLQESFSRYEAAYMEPTPHKVDETPTQPEEPPTGDGMAEWFMAESNRRIDAEEPLDEEQAAQVVKQARHNRQVLEDMIETAADYHNMKPILRLAAFHFNQLNRWSPEHLRSEAEKIRKRNVKSGSVLDEATSMFLEQMRSQPVNREPTPAEVS